MAKVLITEPLAQAGIELLRRHHEVDVRSKLSHAELLEAVRDADALVVRSATKVTAEVLAAAPNLKVIGRAGIGLDNVDVATATKQGVMVVNAPQSNVVSAAEHTIALLLAQARNIPQAHTALRAGRWERSRFTGAELYGKTLGVIGLGRVGTLVAHRLHAFGMRIVAYDPFVSHERAAQMDIELAELDEVLARSDFVTIHLPKTPETVGLLGAERLARMKQGARLVNTARGGIVDEAALAKAVESGHLAGAAVDVFAEEPTTTSPLFEVNDIVVTPHLGASTAEAQDKAGITIAEQVILALDNQFVPFAVNVDAGQFPDAVRVFMPLAEKLGRLYTTFAQGGPGGPITVEVLGDLAEHDTRVLTLAVLKGMLAPIVSEPVTFVNAPLIAADRGLSVTETKSRRSRDWVNLLTVSGQGPRGPLSVSGTTVGPRDTERLVSVGDLEIDMAPAEYMAFFFYADRPGIIGKVGTMLGEAGINIAAMQVGRREAGGEALMTLTVDSPIPADVLDDIIAAIEAHDGKFVQFPNPTDRQAGNRDDQGGVSRA